jgi:hypothetical protein
MLGGLAAIAETSKQKLGDLGGAAGGAEDPAQAGSNKFIKMVRFPLRCVCLSCIFTLVRVSLVYAVPPHSLAKQ